MDPFWGFSSILVTSARSEEFFQRATLPHLFTDTQLSVSVLNFNWTNGNAKLIPLLCLQLSHSFQETGCFSSKLQSFSNSLSDRFDIQKQAKV